MADSNDTRSELLQHFDACCELSDRLIGQLHRVQPYAMPQTPTHIASMRQARSHLGAALALLEALP